MFISDAQWFRAKTGLALTRHAWQRIQERNISLRAAAEAFLYGRRAHVRGSVVYAIGRKEIAEARREGVDLSAEDGVQIVCSPRDEVVITAYRNRDFRGLRK